MWYKLSDQCCIRNGDRHTSHGNRFPVDASGLIGQGDNLLDVFSVNSFLFRLPGMMEILTGNGLGNGIFSPNPPYLSLLYKRYSWQPLRVRRCMYVPLTGISTLVHDVSKAIKSSLSVSVTWITMTGQLT